MSVDANLERALGPQETLFVELIRRCNGGIQLVSMAEFEAPQEVDQVRHALKLIHRRHPMMRGRIEERDALWWVCDVPFEHIEIRIEPMLGDFDLPTVYATEAADAIDVEKSSWRAVLYTNAQDRVAWIVIVSNHAGIDGRSALVVLNDLDTLLTSPGTWTRDALPLMAPAEAGLAAAGLSGDRALLPKVRQETMWPLVQSATSQQRQPHGFLRVVPQSTVAAVHRRMHAEGVHLAAAFAAAAVRAADALPNRTDWTTILAPTDVRADCSPPVPGYAVGQYVAGINLLLGPEFRDASLIDTARELQSQFTKNRPPSLLMDEDVPLSETIKQVDQMAAANRVFTAGLCVTDVGDFNQLSGRRVGFKDVLLLPSQNHGIHPVLIAIVSTNAGACLSFGYDSPLQTSENAHAFADRFVESFGMLAAS